MSLEYRIRDYRRPPTMILQEVGVKQGMTVLDFGCGPGGFALAAARLVGPVGLVYALDIHPLAIKCVKRAALRYNIRNIRAVLGQDIPGAPDGSVDVILLYDVLHHLSDPGPTMAEFYRLISCNGVLSVRDHRLGETRLLADVTVGGLFGLQGQNRRVFQFKKTEPDERRT
jgi:ubiquinone/menaquinone biosynthesis C-methylase UbiE